MKTLENLLPACFPSLPSGIYLFQEIAEVLVVIDPFKKPHGFKTGEFGWSAKCYINNRVLSMIMSTNEKLYLQSLD